MLLLKQPKSATKRTRKFTADDTLLKQNIKQLETAIGIVSKANAVNFLMQKGGGKGRAPGESSFILGTFKGLMQNLVKNQAEGAAAEAKKQENFDKLAATKNAQLLALRDDREKKLVLIGETKQDLAEKKLSYRVLTRRRLGRSGVQTVLQRKQRF